MIKEPEERSGRTTWIIISLIVFTILLKGMYAFVLVGDRGMPNWDYRPVVDVPGKSAYAVYESLPYPQHVRGREGE